MNQEEIYEAKENAELANKTKSSFLANMSHELRTPLNAIIGYSELMIEDKTDSSESQKLQDLNNISSSGHHLLSLINDILDISKIEAGKINLSMRETDINRLINETIETIRPSLEKNNDTLVIKNAASLTHAIVDPIRLKQALMNLFSNAVKFTENGVITITTDHTLHEDKTWITIQVMDTGIGIPENEIDILFQPFQQSTTGSEIKYGGTGLGLAISRRVCRLMGGDISIKSIEGEGSTFTIWLPIYQPHEIEDQQKLPNIAQR